MNRLFPLVYFVVVCVGCRPAPLPSQPTTGIGGPSKLASLLEQVNSGEGLEALVDHLSESSLSKVFADSEIDSLQLTEAEFMELGWDDRNRMTGESIQIAQALKSVVDHCWKNRDKDQKYEKLGLALADELSSEHHLMPFQQLGQYSAEKFSQ